MKLILVRHGETAWNAQKRYQGTKNPGLNDKGRKQAKAVANELKHEKIDAIYCSPMRRARETLEEIIKFHPSIEPVFLDNLVELNYGGFEGLTKQEIAEKFGDYLHERVKKGIHFKYPSGESVAELLERIIGVLERLKKKHFGQIVLIVGHSNANKAMLHLIVDFPKEDFYELYHPHDLIYIVDLKEEKPKVRHKYVGKKQGEGLVRLKWK